MPPANVGARAAAATRLREWVARRLDTDAQDIARLYRASRETLFSRLRNIYQDFLGADPSFAAARSGPALAALNRAVDEEVDRLTTEVGRASIDKLARLRREGRGQARPRLERLVDLPAEARYVLNELTTSVVGGGTYFDRLTHLSAETKRELEGSIRRSLLNGETFDELRDKAMRVFGVDRLQEPRGPAYGSVKVYKNEARRQHNLLMRDIARREDGEMVWWATVGDPATTPGCLARHGRFVDRDLGGELPPRHVNCRCEVAVFEPGDDLAVHREEALAELQAMGYTLAEAELEEAYKPDQPRGTGGRWTSKGDGDEPVDAGHDPAHQYYQKGPGLPPVVFRGGPSEETSPEFGKVAYVSTDPASAAQYGATHSWDVTRQPKLLDLGDWHGPAKGFVARLLGADPTTWGADDYDQAAAEVFIQGQGVERLRKLGYDGYRFGRDAMLLGRLSDYASKREAYRPDQPRVRGKFAPEGTPDEEERLISKFTRRETPAQRRARIRGLKVDPEQAAAVRRAFLSWGHHQLAVGRTVEVALSALPRLVAAELPWRYLSVPAGDLPALVRRGVRLTEATATGPARGFAGAGADHVLVRACVEDSNFAEALTVDGVWVPLHPPHHRFRFVTGRLRPWPGIAMLETATGRALDSADVTVRWDAPRRRLPWEALRRWPAAAAVTFPEPGPGEAYAVALVDGEAAAEAATLGLNLDALAWRTGPTLTEAAAAALAGAVPRDPWLVACLVPWRPGGTFGTVTERHVEAVVALGTGYVLFARARPFVPGAAAPYDRVAVVAITADGKVWAVRPRGRPVWSLPGGHVDENERRADAAAREMREETGRAVRVRRALGVLHRPWSTTHVYLGELIGDVAAVATPGEVDAVAPVAVDDLEPAERVFVKRVYGEVKGQS